MLNMKIARIKKGLRQTDLAKQVGMSPSTINRIEVGKQDVKQLKFESIEKIANALDITVNELIEK
ncbi:transcriptional regulator [[Clostridium] sordellii]|uniref:helix-turn-helix domain-containing protein n=1 Tax=Paraclostridium sordellii TaxID=1505 RepID=UPI0005E92092|nr:helix-turn-helix transcriptional regulator [Paeniclostridium sordellii]MDU4413998.1 helix-turn-helix transcriptional regulator [Paeniclostridium sordellii]MRZ28337.1 helix-turn-helix domain-containing protein [Paeniclostridium sordellii]CEN90089.1 transcriptional regulator [[Clostridium] sordellii] [Paeniclostridium sordellii]CEO36544.1 transcriptional regulator [[Clostridium] sordellii] [Paeniclostridium sordellii]